MSSTVQPIREFAKKLAFRYASLGAPEYPYIVEPIQLATFINELDRVKNVSGSILEIGVSRGMTTRFICEHLVASGRTHEKFCAIDTFESFVPRDIDYEVKHRGKAPGDIWGFGYIDYDSWMRNFKKFPFVTGYKSDCATFDYSLVAPIKFAFLDVDLYLATKGALRHIYANLADGGVILVDDVMQPSRWDGAYQAYTEFCDELSLPFNQIGTKMGVIRR